MKQYLLKSSLFVAILLVAQSCNQGEKHRVTQSFRYLNLEGSDFSQSKLARADFSHANLDKADFSDAMLAGANFEDASMKSANLQGADLEGANLTNADLKGADLKGAYFRGAIFEGASLIDVRAKDGQFQEAKGLSKETIIDLQKQGAHTD